MTEQVDGRCLCGGVRFTVAGPFDAFHWCHCSRCRRDTGSAHASNLFTRPGAIRWTSGEDLIRRFDLPEAERFATAFCSCCGSPVPYLNRSGTEVIVPAGSLDDAPGLAPQDNIHWGSRAAWYDSGVAARKYDAEPEN